MREVICNYLTIYKVNPPPLLPPIRILVSPAARRTVVCLGGGRSLLCRLQRFKLEDEVVMTPRISAFSRKVHVLRKEDQMQNRDSGLVLNLVVIVGGIVFVFIAYQMLAVPILNSPAVQALIHAFGG